MEPLPALISANRNSRRDIFHRCYLGEGKRVPSRCKAINGFSRGEKTMRRTIISPAHARRCEILVKLLWSPSPSPPGPVISLPRNVDFITRSLFLGGFAFYLGECPEIFLSALPPHYLHFGACWCANKLVGLELRTHLALQTRVPHPLTTFCSRRIFLGSKICQVSCSGEGIKTAGLSGFSGPS